MYVWRVNLFIATTYYCVATPTIAESANTRQEAVFHELVHAKGQVAAGTVVAGKNVWKCVHEIVKSVCPCKVKQGFYASIDLCLTILLMMRACLCTRSEQRRPALVETLSSENGLSCYPALCRHVSKLGNRNRVPNSFKSRDGHMHN